MNKEAPLNVQHFETYELKKKIMNIKTPFNVCNLKTKPLFDKWSVTYDKALENTAFLKEREGKKPIMTALLCVSAFQKSPDGN